MPPLEGKSHEEETDSEEIEVTEIVERIERLEESLAAVKDGLERVVAAHGELAQIFSDYVEASNDVQ